MHTKIGKHWKTSVPGTGKRKENLSSADHPGEWLPNMDKEAPGE
jgi:hypothetical protein